MIEYGLGRSSRQGAGEELVSQDAVDIDCTFCVADVEGIGRTVNAKVATLLGEGADGQEAPNSSRYV